MEYQIPKCPVHPERNLILLDFFPKPIDKTVWYCSECKEITNEENKEI